MCTVMARANVSITSDTNQLRLKKDQFTSRQTLLQETSPLPTKTVPESSENPAAEDSPESPAAENPTANNPTAEGPVAESSASATETITLIRKPNKRIASKRLLSFVVCGGLVL